jgi:fatty acid desaturase
VARQIFGSRRANYILGILFGNLGIGLNDGWWVGKHNRHHAHPNQEGADPDIWVSALAFTAAQARAAGARGGWRSAIRPTCSARYCCWKRSART